MKNLFFENIQLLPPDPILGVNQAFKGDTRENKVNLGVGAYKTIDLKPLILNTVKKVEHDLLQSESSKDYLPIGGLAEYCRSTKELVFGSAVDNERMVSLQTVGATAALRVGAAFLREQGFSTIYVSDPTWENHHRVFAQAGLTVKTYPYYDPKEHCFNWQAFRNALREMPLKEIILLQPCCHNPTGFDPTFEQWKEIGELIRERQLFVFFDFAYQGFGESVEADANVIRYFAKEGLSFAVAISHAKNFGLYAERAGALLFLADTPDLAKRLHSNLTMIIRGIYSNPPCHGALIVSAILNNAELKEHWLCELSAMRERISDMRKSLMAELQSKATHHSFDFLAHQKGMFSYTGLHENAVEQLKVEYGIYMPKNGRINVAGLNTGNVGYVADAIVDVME